MKIKELLKMLRDDLQLIHSSKPGKVTVPIHGGDIPRGTLNSILTSRLREAMKPKTINTIE